ncbi:hypothetical protein [Lentzea sp. NPDC051838]|uniref:hypothetical protein n=1 Tax=Lentzea sp. NPDC051838 TaxID=3154849 RepID=UPI00343338DF
MRKTMLAAAVLAAVLLPAVPASAGVGPSCPEKAPAGATFVRHVQPPFGLGYDEYRLQSGEPFQVYC